MSAGSNTLERLCEPDRHITYGVVKPGPEIDDGIRLIRGGDVFQGRIAEAELRTISTQISEQYKRTLLKGGELLISLVGNPGEVAVVPDTLAGANIARQVGLVPLGPQVNHHFVMYFLRSFQGRAQLFTRTQGAVQQVINLADLKTIEIPDMPLGVQDRIASILSAYDDLIENNRRRIQLLEQAARLLYKEWFVHLRFPGHEHVTITDGVPEGWERKKLSDLFEIRWGDTNTTKAAYVDEGYAAFSAAGCDGKLDHYDHEGPGIVLSAIGAYCGKSWYVDGQWSCIKNTIYIKSLNHSNADIRFLYYSIRDARIWPKRGGAQPFISQTDARNVVLPISDISTRHHFDDVVARTLAQLACLERMNVEIRKARDLLLPRLMNGELAA